MEKKYISHNSLKNLLTKLREAGKQIVAPVTKGDKTDFKRIDSADELSTEPIQTTMSAKGIIFPRAERLFSYTKQEDDITVEDSDSDSIPETVVFGIHPCDAVGFIPLSAIFNWDTKDVFFNKRIQKTTLVSISCTKCDEYCFCTSVNGNPGNTEGSDILLTPVKEANGYLVEIITDKGKTLIQGYDDLFEAAPDIDKEKQLAQVPVRFNVEDLHRKIPHMFDSSVWKKQSERCLGCGACAFVCPTCACFDIQENVRGKSGDRLRCWDSCGFSLFTLHTSGHNPRQAQSQRWRQRLLHKFAYMPERLSVRGCTGCGRCSRACPVDMNLSEHLTELSKM